MDEMKSGDIAKYRNTFIYPYMEVCRNHMYHSSQLFPAAHGGPLDQ